MTEERAAKIANDIAEDIDCKESRKELREAIRYFAMDSNYARVELSALKSKIRCDFLMAKLKRLSKKLKRQRRST